MDVKKQLLKLTEIGIALTAERDISKLLAKILREARYFANAEAGTLYIKEQNKLRFAVTQNDGIDNPTGAPEAADASRSTFLRGLYLEISKKSMAGYVAYTGEVLNIDDVYHISSEKEYSFNPEFDKKQNYRCQSMLIVPMKDEKNEVIGVVQLINAKNERKETITFLPEIEPLVLSIASQAAVALRNAQLHDEMKRVYLDTIYRLSVAAEYKDTDTGMHIKRMSHYSAIIASELGFSDDVVENILYASPMHDIGKIGIPDGILKKPGKLTDEEFDTMKTHTIIGAQILSQSDNEILKLSEKIALTHHEKYDGSGYPNKIKGEEIPIEGRIVAVADVFDALTSPRCYKPPFPVEKALSIIKEGSGTHFDSKCVDAMLSGLKRILEVKSQYKDPIEEDDEGM